jgi:chemotaxis protein MotA
MNISTAFGFLLGLAVIAVSVATHNDQIHIFFNLNGLIIVVGGTLASTFVSFNWADMRRACRGLYVAMKREPARARRDINDLITIAQHYRQGKIAELSRLLEKVENPFLRLGVELAIDKSAEDEDIVEVLRWRMEKLKHKERVDAAIFRAMASYAPAFGMMGTLFGLVFMLTGLAGNDFKQIGESLAVALMTTLYGIILSYLIFKPIAAKLETRTLRRLALMHMIFEGVLLIRQRRSPSVVRETLYSLVAELDNELLCENHLPPNSLRNSKLDVAAG